MVDRQLADARAIDRAVLVAVDLGDRARPIEPELEELQALLEAAGAAVVETIVQRRSAVDPSTFIGSGKVHEIAEHVMRSRATFVAVLGELRPRQRRRLEELISVPIVDRTMVILDVFARQARSREGKMQVELAQLRYRQSNLIGAGSDLSRLGGGIGTRGPGETKLEVDRRRIGQRIGILQQRLEEVRRQRAIRRSDRREPLAALVGYTNVGKSSLLNRLARSDALVADRPFATLDPTVRRVWLAEGRYVRVVDTVGFITDLPKDLVTAFRATLEELNEADVLVHVVDASRPDRDRQMSAVNATLHDLQLDRKPVLLVFNKSDAAIELPQRDELHTSARTGEGLDTLKRALNALLP